MRARAKGTYEVYGTREDLQGRALIADHQGTRSGGGLYAHGAKGDSQG